MDFDKDKVETINLRLRELRAIPASKLSISNIDETLALIEQRSTEYAKVLRFHNIKVD